MDKPSQNPLEQNSPIRSVDIVIVGAGMVGASLALGITQKTQFSVTLIDASDPLGGRSVEQSLGLESIEIDSIDPRVSAINHSSQALLTELGVWDQMLDARINYYEKMTVWEEKGTGRIQFDRNDLGVSHLGSLVENSNILTALHAKLSNSNADIQLANPIKSMVNSENGYVITLFDGQMLEAKLLIGADGALSWVKQRLDFGSREWSYEHKAIVATVKHNNSHENTAWQVFLDTGPLAFLPLFGGKKTRTSFSSEVESEVHSSIVWSAKENAANRLMSLSDEDFLTELNKKFEGHLGGCVEVSRRFAFPLRQRHAINYVARHSVLVGDSAHTIHPLAGQGVNLGFNDVSTLLHQLTYASDNQLEPYDQRILKRYQRQVKAKNLSMMGLMEGFKRLFEQDNLAIRWLRNMGMKLLDSQRLIKSKIAKQALF